MSGTRAAKPVIAHPAWREAMVAVQAALRPGAVVAVLGEAGTGKTWLLRALLAELHAAGRDAMLLDRGDAALPEDRAGIVLVNEAERLGATELGVLAAAPMGGLVVAGLPGFGERLAGLPGAAVIVPLRALRPPEAAAFVREQAVAKGARLGTAAVAEVVARGGGLPRMLDRLLNAGMFVASLEAAPEVTAAHVTEAMALRGEFAEPVVVEAPEVREALPAEERRESLAVERAPARLPRALALLALLLLLGVGLAANFVLRAPSPQRMVAVAAPSPPAPVPAPVVAGAPVVAAVVDSSGPALPPGVAPHVVLSYWREDEAAHREGIEVVQGLRSAGVSVSDPLPVLRRLDPGIAYFFADDAANAGAVGRDLDGQFGAGRAAPLRPDEGLPRPGTIELRLPGSPPASVRIAAAGGDGPEAVTPVRPADGAAIEGKRVMLAWRAPAYLAPLSYFVEMRALDPTPAQEVFGGYTAATALTVPVEGPGRYAWRVVAVSREPARYTVGAWSMFRVGEAR